MQINYVEEIYNWAKDCALCGSLKGVQIVKKADNGRGELSVGMKYI